MIENKTENIDSIILKLQPMYLHWQLNLGNKIKQNFYWPCIFNFSLRFPDAAVVFVAIYFNFLLFYSHLFCFLFVPFPQDFFSFLDFFIFLVFRTFLVFDQWNFWEEEMSEWTFHTIFQDCMSIILSIQCFWLFFIFRVIANLVRNLRHSQLARNF